MKAIYKGRDVLCVVVEEEDLHVVLEPVGGLSEERFSVQLCDDRLVLDPTDDEVAACEQE